MLTPLLADLAYLSLKVRNQVLKSLLLLRFLGKELVFLVDQFFLQCVIECGVFMVPRLASLMVS